MKAPMNGGINLSVLDGWWCEGYRGRQRLGIGAGEEYEEKDQEYQDGSRPRASTRSSRRRSCPSSTSGAPTASRASGSR